MQPKLIVLNGPPGVGKTAVARRLLTRVEPCAWLDGDDVWRFRPFEVNERTKAVAERNIPFVFQAAARCPNLPHSWNSRGVTCNKAGCR